jgi:hypothetical protein
LILGLGIGANTAIFSLVNGVLNGQHALSGFRNRSAFHRNQCSGARIVRICGMFVARMSGYPNRSYHGAPGMKLYHKDTKNTKLGTMENLHVNRVLTLCSLCLCGAIS